MRSMKMSKPVYYNRSRTFLKGKNFIKKTNED